MKMLVYNVHPYEFQVLRDGAGKHHLSFTEKHLSSETAHLAMGCEAVSVFHPGDVSPRALESLQACGVRYLLLRSGQFNQAKLRRASELGIQMENVSAVSPWAVAEHAVAMLLALNRKLFEGQKLMSGRDFRIDKLVGSDIHGKTVGVVGMGKTGTAFAQIMISFGTKVLANDPRPDEDAISQGIEYVSLEELMNRSDIVSIHCPLNRRTRHLIADPQFNWMKRGAILINTSDGAVINTAHLIGVLESGRLAGACLDGYEFEQGLFFEDHRRDHVRDAAYLRLKSFDNVLLTGHHGFLTDETLRRMSEATFARLEEFETSGKGIPVAESRQHNARPAIVVNPQGASIRG